MLGCWAKASGSGSFADPRRCTLCRDLSGVETHALVVVEALQYTCTCRSKTAQAESLLEYSHAWLERPRGDHVLQPASLSTD